MDGFEFTANASALIGSGVILVLFALLAVLAVRANAKRTEKVSYLPWRLGATGVFVLIAAISFVPLNHQSNLLGQTQDHYELSTLKSEHHVPISFLSGQVQDGDYPVSFTQKNDSLTYKGSGFLTVQGNSVLLEISELTQRESLWEALGRSGEDSTPAVIFPRTPPTGSMLPE